MKLEIKGGTDGPAKSVVLNSFLSKGISIRHARVREPSAGLATLGWISGEAPARSR